MLIYWALVSVILGTIRAGLINDLSNLARDQDGILDPECMQHFKSFQAQFKTPCENGTTNCKEQKRNFMRNFNKLKNLNDSKPEFKVGFTKFMTWSEDQLKKRLMKPGTRPRKGHKKGNKTRRYKRNLSGKGLATPSVDWRTTGAVNPIKDQGSCGDCWIFAAVAAIEIQSNYVNKRVNNNRRTYEEQFLLNCVQKDGCDGGWPADAFNYVKKNGIPRAPELKYIEKQKACQKNMSLDHPVTSQRDLTDSPSQMLKFIQSTGPLVACFNVCDDFNYYTGGVYSTNCKESSKSYQGGHAVTLIGYGTSAAGVDYWLARNQWGADWGMGGYFMIKRGVDLSDIESYDVSAPKMALIA